MPRQRCMYCQRIFVCNGSCRKREFEAKLCECLKCAKEKDPESWRSREDDICGRIEGDNMG